MCNYNKKAIVFSDLDGTALQSNHKFSERTKAVVKKMYEKGMLFCPVTARNIKNVFSLASDLGIDDLGGIIVAGNGSAIYDFKNNTYIVNNVFDKSIIKKIFDITYSRTGEYKVYFNSDNKKYAYGIGDDSLYWANVMDVEYIIINKIQDIDEDIKDISVILPNDVNQEKINKFYEEFKELDQYLDIIKYTDRVYQIAVKGVNKGYAIKKICEYLNIDSKITTTYAFGDNFNDFELLKSADISIAMGNALDDLKAIASEITLTNDDDGVALFIEKNILN